MRIGRRLTNLPALRAIGFPANRRLLRAQRLSHDPILGARAFHDATNPVITDNGTRTAALRFGDQRVHALLCALLVFRLQPHGFANKDLRALVAPLRGQPPDTLTAGQMTYDLRRLRVHGLIERIEHTHCYRLTDPGLRQAMFLVNSSLKLTLAASRNFDPSGPGRLGSAMGYPGELLTMKVLSIDRCGRVVDVELAVDECVGVAPGLRAVIGCAALEAVAVDGGMDLWVDEDGIAAAKPVNALASLLARGLGVPVRLRGTVVVTSADRENGCAIDLTDIQVADVRRRLGARG